MSGIYVDQPEIKQKPVSTVRAQNSLWLVKVPKYVTDRLSKCEPGSQFGVIQTQRSAAGQEVIVTAYLFNYYFIIYFFCRVRWPIG